VFQNELQVTKQELYPTDIDRKLNSSNSFISRHNTKLHSKPFGNLGMQLYRHVLTIMLSFCKNDA